MRNNPLRSYRRSSYRWCNSVR